jgi:hypothetical protein
MDTRTLMSRARSAGSAAPNPAYVRGAAGSAAPNPAYVRGAGSAKRTRLRQDRACARYGFSERAGVHLDPHETHPELGTGVRCRSQAQKGIGYRADPVESMKTQAHFGKLRGERCGMGPLLLTVLNRLARYEPGVPAATNPGRRRPPASNVRLVLCCGAEGVDAPPAPRPSPSTGPSARRPRSGTGIPWAKARPRRVAPTRRTRPRTGRAASCRR